MYSTSSAAPRPAAPERAAFCAYGITPNADDPIGPDAPSVTDGRIEPGEELETRIKRV